MITAQDIIDLGTAAAQLWYDSTFGILFEGGIAEAAVVISLLIFIVLLALWGVRQIFTVRRR